MRERIIRVGDEGRLVGVASEPFELDDGRPAFLMLNAGVVHRVGPNRLHVDLARRLARAGLPACRFDVSGLGDSGARTDGLPYPEARIHDTRDVMDHLGSIWGVNRFVTIGLCSGADHAFRMALADSRVVASVMVDGYVYPTRRHTLAGRGRRIWSARRRLFQREAWKRVASGRHPLWGSLRSGLLRRRDVRMRFVMDVPPRREAEAGVRALVGRGVHLLFVYTANHAGLYQSTVRAGRPFPPDEPTGRVRVVCFPDVDHEFTLVSRRRELFRTLVDWAVSVWPVTEVGEHV